VAAIADARKDADSIQIGKAATIVDYIDGAQSEYTQASKLLPPPSSLAPIGAILDKIDVFVKIVDKTASVCDQIRTWVFIAECCLPRSTRTLRWLGGLCLRCTRSAENVTMT
jgi:hypothetical protein